MCFFDNESQLEKGILMVCVEH